MVRVPVFLALVFLLPYQAAAQEAIERVVHGVVFDSVAQQPLGGVTFYFEGRKDEFSSSSGGQFRIAGVRLRDSVLVVRRIGFVPLRVIVRPAGAAVAVDLGVVRMKPVATRLDRIAVEAEEVNRFPLLADFYRRKQHNAGGAFITREDIERSGARRTSDMLRRVNKIEMDCPNERSGGDNCIARNRRGRNVTRGVSPEAARQRARMTVSSPEDTASLEIGMDRCVMEVYVDGLRSSLQPDEVPLPWIAGIEVYSGLATTPPGLGSGRCGVVAIWTTATIGGQ